MKSVLLMTLAGTGLFGGTVVGLLGVQGRLNFDGTRGVPVLEEFFKEPKAEGEDARATLPGEEPPRLEGLGREAVLPRELGPSLDGAEIPAGGQPAVEPAEGDETGAAHGRAADGQNGQTGHPADFEHRKEGLMGQDQYRRGKLFVFPQLDSGMSVGELDRILKAAEQLKSDLVRRQASLDQRDADLAAREADIEDRQRAVLEKMREVLQQRSKLTEEITAFERTYTLVRGNEVAQFTGYAERLGSLDSEKASQIILQMWQTEEGQARATKILKLMSGEAKDELFSVLTAEQTQAILDRLSRAAVEPPK